MFVLARLAFWVSWWSLTLPLVVLVRRLRHGRARPTWGYLYELFATWMLNAEWANRWLPLPTARALIDGLGMLSPFGQYAFAGHADGPVPATWHGRADGPVLLYLHGGAFLLGSTSAYRDSLAHISRASQMRVLAPDYRLAPEHPPPAQLEDALATYRWLLEQVPADQIFVAGDSAGGNLTACLLIALRDNGEPLPAGACLISPWVDLREQAIDSPWDYVPPDLHEMYSMRYAGEGADLADPKLSPVEAELSGLPPLLVMVGGAERLRDCGRVFADRATKAGVAVAFDEVPDQVHAWPLFAAFLPEARRSLMRMGEFARDCVHKEELRKAG